MSTSGLESVLWEDLGQIEGHTAKACETLQAITQAIQEGLVGEPNHRDSKRLNRLVVLTEMLHNEIQQWASEIDMQH